MAKKKSASAKKSSSDKKSVPKKPVAELYPRPERVTYRSDDPTVDIVAKLKEAMTVEDRRMDLKSRLESITKAMRGIVLPYYGDYPKDFTPEQWADIEYREQTFYELPGSHPSEARDAFEALRVIQRIRREIKAVQAGHQDAAVRAVCWAIDLGLLVQRVDVQLSFGTTVAEGRSLIDARSAGSAATSSRAVNRSELAKTEFLRRKKLWRSEREKSSTLKNMASIKNDDGTLVYGSLSTLKRYSKDWK